MVFIAQPASQIEEISGLRAELDALAASTGDKTHIHDQIPASLTWVITHNLNKHPSVNVEDSSGEQVWGKVTYDSVNQLTIQFSSPLNGRAFCN